MVFFNSTCAGTYIPYVVIIVLLNYCCAGNQDHKMDPDALIEMITSLCVVFMANLALLQRSFTTYMRRRRRLMMLVQITNIFLLSRLLDFRAFCLCTQSSEEGAVNRTCFILGSCERLSIRNRIMPVSSQWRRKQL